MVWWNAGAVGVGVEGYCRNSVCPVVGMGEGITWLGVLVGYGIASWAELVRFDFDVDSLRGLIDMYLWVPEALGECWDFSYLGDDVVLDFLDVLYVIWCDGLL